VHRLPKIEHFFNIANTAPVIFPDSLKMVAFSHEIFVQQKSLLDSIFLYRCEGPIRMA
jgi:hypothetical protein